MNFNVFFIKKQYIYYIFIVTLIFVLFILFILSKNTSYIFSTSNDKKAILNYDLTGDGTKDVIQISNHNNYYNVSVSSHGKTYSLSPNIIGNFSEYWPLRITLLDVSRDKLPEIFLQASEDNNSVLNVFLWNENKFQNVLHTKNNLLGFLDYHTNKSPKIVLGDVNSSSIDFYNYFITKNNLTKYPGNYEDNFLGKNCILEFVKYIKNLPYDRMYIPNEIFSENSYSSLNATSDVLCNNTNYSFEDGIFIDDKYDNNGNLTYIDWILNFKANSLSDKNSVKNYTIKLTLKQCENIKIAKYNYKIVSCNLIKNINPIINVPK